MSGSGLSLVSRRSKVAHDDAMLRLPYTAEGSHEMSGPLRGRRENDDDMEIGRGELVYWSVVNNIHRKREGPYLRGTFGRRPM